MVKSCIVNIPLSIFANQFAFEPSKMVFSAETPIKLMLLVKLRLTFPFPWKIPSDKWIFVILSAVVFSTAFSIVLYGESKVPLLSSDPSGDT